MLLQKVGIAVAAVLILVYSTIFTVREGEVGIVFQFGKVVRDSSADAKGDKQPPKIYMPGVHFKLPIIETVKKLDVRIQTLDSQADRFVTSEKKDLIIDSYVKWKIDDPAKFFLTTNGGDYMMASDLLKNKINNGLRSEIGSRTIKEIVSGERSEVMQNALLSSASSAELGIKVIDVRIKQINLPVEVSNSIYQRMRAERNAVAKEHRAQGVKQAEFIRAEVDREVAIMIATAEKNAKETKGNGDAQAVKIYADAYKLDQNLFTFLKSMNAYKASMTNGSKNVIVVKPESEFFDNFDQIR